jgi:hypothetical protein
MIPRYPSPVKPLPGGFASTGTDVGIVNTALSPSRTGGI